MSLIKISVLHLGYASDSRKPKRSWFVSCYNKHGVRAIWKTLKIIFYRSGKAGKLYFIDPENLEKDFIIDVEKN